MERYLWSAIAGRRLRSGISGIGGVFPAIPYVGIFAATSRDAILLDQSRLTVFRVKGQAERTKAEHAPDKAVQKPDKGVSETDPDVRSRRSHFSVTGYSKVDAADSGAQSLKVNEAGRLSMASPPIGGLRDAAGFAICASDDNVATDIGAEHDATG
jgi:hypothetical protein